MASSDSASSESPPARAARGVGLLGALRSEEGLAIAALAVLAACAGAASALGAPFWITLATKAAILALAGVGLNLALGYGGLVSLGHAAFFGAGGYVAGVLAYHAANYEPILAAPVEIGGTTQMLLIWPIALLVGGALAALIGALSLRSSGVYFIMITLAFAQMIYYFAISWPTYGGEDGLSIYVRNALPYLDTLDGLTYFCVCLGVLALALLLVSTLLRSRFGLALEVSRQSEDRLHSVGVAAFPVRSIAFSISGALTALAGALYADLNRFVSPDMLSWHMSGELIVFVILGGVGRLSGPVIGATLYVLLEHLLAPVSEYWKVLLGLLLLAIVLWARGGVAQALAGEKRRG